MQIQVRHSPSFAVARALLAAGEPVRVEAGAMVATSYGVMLEARAEGGILKSLTRAALGAESFFLTTYTAPAHGGWVDLAPNLPGDVTTVEVGETNWCLTRGSWLGSATTVELTTQWAGFRSIVGGEGGFLVHASGAGPVVLSCYGALDVHDLGPGEYVTVDSGHVVAYTESVQSRIRSARPGMMQSMKSGEGLVFDFAGPGRLLTQTRNPRGLVTWLQTGGPGGRQ